MRSQIEWPLLKGPHWEELFETGGCCKQHDYSVKKKTHFQQIFYSYIQVGKLLGL